MTFYGSYHHHPVNKAIHIVFVPLIWWSVIVLLCNTGPVVPFSAQDLVGRFGFSLPAVVAENLVLNASFFVFVFYATYYLILGDLFAAITFDGVLLLMLLSANAFFKSFGPQANTYAFLVHVFSWYMQIHLGHMVFEGRKPALFDSLFQSLVLAPLFVWIEVLFLFGYRKEMAERLEKSILAAIADFQKNSRKNQ